MARITAEPVSSEAVVENELAGFRRARGARRQARRIEAAAPPELADVLNEVAGLAAPLERSPIASGPDAARGWTVDGASSAVVAGRSAHPARSTSRMLQEDETQFGVDATSRRRHRFRDVTSAACSRSGRIAASGIRPNR